MTTYTNINSYERLQLYNKCEFDKISFCKIKTREDRWICRDHKCLLVPVDNPECSDLCCLKCPVDGCDNENFKKVSTKVTNVIVETNNDKSSVGIKND